jgi:hypothetical protein
MPGTKPTVVRFTLPIREVAWLTQVKRLKLPKGEF